MHEILKFPPLEAVDWLIHGFTLREDNLDLTVERKEALLRLEERHQLLLKNEGIQWEQLRLAEQVHGNKVVIIEDLSASSLGIGKSKVALENDKIAETDGLVTAQENCAIGIHVADCCAVFLIEKEKRAIGLLHSGRRGTEANIAREGIRQLQVVSGGNPSNIIAVLSPCIHFCCYEVDFVAQIEQQLKAEGVKEIYSEGDCTGCCPSRYYSYRKEKGKTGRMLGFMMIVPQERRYAFPIG